MDSPHPLLLLFSGVFAIICLVQAQDQQGFISLDCGLPMSEPSPYIEPLTGLQFSSDAKFIQTGKTGKIQTNLESDYLKPYIRLRYFPDGVRNCYSLSVDKDRKYLIRARFIYGNYDGLNSNPEFDLHLGPNPWDTISLQQFVNGTVKEIVHTPTSNSLQICLIKTGTTTPVISALELRPLGNNSYPTQSGSLNVFSRIYFNKTGDFLRYPDDVYDRRWIIYFLTSWTQISATLNVSNDNDYDPPKRALATAATPSNAGAPLTISWTSANPVDQYYLYSHFAEIQDLQTNDTREFELFWNGADVSEPVIPSKVRTIRNFSPVTCKGGTCTFQLIKTSRYYRTTRLGEKSDVYSFGIVLLEMITNQPVIDQSREKSHITQWVGFQLNRGDITKIMDPNLHGDYDSRSVWRVLELAMSCANPSSVNRPNMSQVANELKECLVSEKSRGNMKMESQTSSEVSMSVDSGMFPRAR